MVTGINLISVTCMVASIARAFSEEDMHVKLCEQGMVRSSYVARPEVALNQSSDIYTFLGHESISCDNVHVDRAKSS